MITSIHSPERDLWAAVLHQAIIDAQSYSTKIISNSAKPTALNCSQAKHWIASRSDHQFSFVNICGILELDPGNTRKLIFSGKKIKMNKG